MDAGPSSDGTAKPPPPKRLRLDVADGFIKSTSPAKISAPKFVSAFDTKSSSSRSKPAVRAEMFQPDFPKLPPHVSRLSISARTSRAPRRVRSPPPVVFPGLKPKDTEVREKRKVPITSRIPERPQADDGSRKMTSIKCLQLRPPPSPLQTKKLAAIKPPPSVPGPSRESGPPMKSIFATAVALATDVHTEQGAAEVLAIRLQQHGHGYVDPTEREIRRGVGYSPEKLSKRNKDPKIRRGGLADCARIRCKQRQTDLSLWQEGLRLDLRNKRSLAPDMRLHIVSVIHAASEAHHQRPTHAPCVGFIRCREVLGLSEIERTILLNFDGAGTPSRFNSPADLQDGREVYVWQPWHTTQLSAVHLSLAPGMDLTDPSTSSGNVSVLFCTRFWIPPVAVS
ncbi:uncharacterized protein FIBRA_04191 [Fibroporia radiculosa]|uniref:Uncharacterized protein n=1 Tax=Fibroporia radiculosa TaxID=599839 RepID=J4H2U1_9APHY|nr:uncharacterized protein FIBRA_04191 [Fibroporia radiculosa]CCM02114.1 predicted protein [Fibroporia radiculosa]